MNKVRFNSLDGMRGLMAVVVLYSHLVGSYYGWEPGRPLVGAGLCVMYFFMLSGFVLSASHSGKEGFSYILIRLARLWPLHIITTILMLSIYAYNKKNGFYYSSDDVFNISVMLKNFFLLHGVVPNKFILLNEPSWSISLEFWSSLLVPFIFMKMELKVKLISIPVLLVIAYNYYPDSLPPNFLMSSICMLIGNASYEVRNSSLLKKYLHSYAFQCLALICLLYCSLGVWRGFSGFESYFYLISFIPMLFIDLTREGFILKRIFCSKIILFLGSISFPFYLFHESVIVSGIASAATNFFIYSSFVFLITLVISYLYDKYIGTPLYKKSRDLISKIN